MSRHRITIATLVAVAAVGGALACGPDFPWQLLDDRHTTMTEPVAFGFSFDAARLVAPPGDRLRAAEQSDSGYRSTSEPEIVVIERHEAESGAWQTLATDLPAGTRTAEAFLSRLQAARAAADGPVALAAGAGLPSAVVNYIAGAVEFHAERYDRAAAYFDAIDALPPDQRAIRQVAADYMKGRIHQMQGEAEAARAAFRAARAHAEAGAPDPMGLAVASFGEEARVDLIEAGLITPAPWPIEIVDDPAKASSLISHAVRLYAEQAARESKIALLSLRQVASLVVADAEVLGRVIEDPLVRRLLVAYAISREGPWDEESSEVVSANVIEAALMLPTPAAGEEIDRLAALAYQTGRYDVAERLVAKTERPLGLWVRAKLALRHSDREAAVRDWTAALAASVKAGDAIDLDEDARTRLRGEAAVAKLSAGAYDESLRLLFPAAQTYWGDVAYVAERILTVDELKNFVDGLPPANPKPRRASSDEPPSRDPTEDLRALLARRLARQGRIAEALPYYPASIDRWSDNPAERKVPLAAEAQDYAAALKAAQPTWRWRNVSRAEALFSVAMMSRTRGMELLGTEGPPDVAAVDGNFSWGYGQESPRGTVGVTTGADAREPLLGPDEATRFAASAPQPDKRFHYRVIAADRAIEAADLLPQGSQAYAATLCWATRFAFDSDDVDRAQSIYRRYVATGPLQPWAKRFGRECPEPDFDAARDYWPKRVVRLAQRHTGLAAAAALGVALLLAGSVFAIRRHRQSAALQAKFAASSGLPEPR
jgi:tetratricopeptide (TPR) repeat protein